MNTLQEVLQRHQFGCILRYDYTRLPVYIFDLTKNNKELRLLDKNNVEAFDRYVQDMLNKNNVPVGIGRYNEDRNIYTSSLFNDGNIRTIHLGIDLRTNQGEEIYCPYDAVVHSFANNNRIGDYGPTIILQHTIDDNIFYTLYGHLNKDSLHNIKVGTCFKRGDKIGCIGNYPFNGNRPPHLHFQIIQDIGKKRGDYPGVCSRSETEWYINNCPNPNIILKISGLQELKDEES